MRIKRLLFGFAALAVICSFFSGTANALNLRPEEMPGGSVYVEEEEREAIFRELVYDEYDPKVALQDYLPNGFNIVKESLSKVYCIDLLEWAKGGQFRIQDFEDGVNLNTGLRLFKINFAKCIDDNGTYIGNLRILYQFNEGLDFQSQHYGEYVCDDLYYSLQLTKQIFPENGSAYLSANYADYAEMIRKRLGRESIVPESAVRVIVLGGMLRMNWGFYINDGETEGVFMVGPEYNYDIEYYQQPYYSEHPENLPRGGLSEFIDMEKLKALSEEVLKRWEGPSAGGASLDLAELIKYSGLEEIQNINEISQYFKENTKTAVPPRTTQLAPVVSKTDGPEELTVPGKAEEFAVVPEVKAEANPWQAWVGIGGTALLVLAAWIAFRRSQKE